VPAYNEPAAMLIETLDALARLDYPDFEVLSSTTTPLRGGVASGRGALRAARRRFRFFHVAPLAGSRPAPHYALARTAPDARSSRSSTPTTWSNPAGCAI